MHERLPGGGRLGELLRALECDGGVHRQLRLLVELRRLGPLLLDLGEARTQRDVLVRLQLRTCGIEIMQIQIYKRCFARAIEMTIDIAESS